MSIYPSQLNLEDAASYRISVQGDLDARWYSFLKDVAVVREHEATSTVTTLMGTVHNQAEMLGVLTALNSLGFPLLLVECVCVHDHIRYRP